MSACAELFAAKILEIRVFHPYLLRKAAFILNPAIDGTVSG
jgi:hypothetical protein